MGRNATKKRKTTTPARCREETEGNLKAPKISKNLKCAKPASTEKTAKKSSSSEKKRSDNSQARGSTLLKGKKQEGGRGKHSQRSVCDGDFSGEGEQMLVDQGVMEDNSEQPCGTKKVFIGGIDCR